MELVRHFHKLQMCKRAGKKKCILLPRIKGSWVCSMEDIERQSLGTKISCKCQWYDLWVTCNNKGGSDNWMFRIIIVMVLLQPKDVKKSLTICDYSVIHPRPTKIYFDNGSEFKAEFDKLCDNMGILAMHGWNP